MISTRKNQTSEECTATQEVPSGPITKSHSTEATNWGYPDGEFPAYVVAASMALFEHTGVSLDIDAILHTLHRRNDADDPKGCYVTIGDGVSAYLVIEIAADRLPLLCEEGFMYCRASDLPDRINREDARMIEKLALHSTATTIAPFLSTTPEYLRPRFNAFNRNPATCQAAKAQEAAESSMSLTNQEVYEMEGVPEPDAPWSGNVMVLSSMEVEAPLKNQIAAEQPNRTDDKARKKVTFDLENVEIIDVSTSPKNGMCKCSHVIKEEPREAQQSQLCTPPVTAEQLPLEPPAMTPYHNYKDSSVEQSEDWPIQSVVITRNAHDSQDNSMKVSEIKVGLGLTKDMIAVERHQSELRFLTSKLSYIDAIKATSPFALTESFGYNCIVEPAVRSVEASLNIVMRDVRVQDNLLYDSIEMFATKGENAVVYAMLPWKLITNFDKVNKDRLVLLSNHELVWLDDRVDREAALWLKNGMPSVRIAAQTTASVIDF